MKKLFYLPIALLSFFSNSQGSDSPDSGSTVSSNGAYVNYLEHNRSQSDQACSEKSILSFSRQSISSELFACCSPSFRSISDKLKELSESINEDHKAINFSLNFLSLRDVKSILEHINNDQKKYGGIKCLDFSYNSSLIWERVPGFQSQLKKFLEFEDRKIVFTGNPEINFLYLVEHLPSDFSDRMIY